MDLIPSPNPAISEISSQAITDTEIGLAIKPLQAGKCPGPDGYTSM